MFERHKSDVGLSVTLTDVPAKAGEVYERGEALIIGDDGCATKASGSCKVAYICYEGKKAKEGDMLRVGRVGDHEEYLTTLSADGSDLKVGDIVTISDDGLEITATAGEGAEIISIIDSAKDGKVIVRLK